MKILYQPITSIKPSGLEGISDPQIEDHWNLYLGYVNQTNALSQELKDLEKNGQESSLSYSDRRRRLGFELNGKIMHELYFSCMTSDKAKASFEKSSPDLGNSIIENFGSYQAWETDFKNCGKTRGIGWVVLGQDIWTSNLHNYFVQEHENGNIAGFAPLLVMDVWEHAYMVDHGSSGRGLYIDSFFKNINWTLISDRFIIKK